MTSVINGIKFILIVISSFILTFFTLKILMDFISYTVIDDSSLLMPTVVLSSFLLALFNYNEIKKNNRNTLEWKQKEQTLEIFEKFHEVNIDGIRLVFEDRRILTWVSDMERRTHEQATYHVSFDEIVSLVEDVKRDLELEEDRERLNEVRNNLLALLKVLNSISVHYTNSLLDKKLTKKLFYLILAKQSFLYMAVFKVHFRDEFTEDFKSLLNEFKIDYKVYRNRSWKGSII